MPKSWFLGPLAATFFATAAFGQQAQQQPPIPPEFVLQACYGKLNAEIADAIGSAAHYNQAAAEVAKLAARTAELEAKLAKVPAYPVDPDAE